MRLRRMPDTERLLLLDGHSLAYRAFYALPVENFSTTTGQPTNAVYGFTAMLINALRDERPTHVAVAFDVSRQTFRTEAYPEYKGNRSASPAEFSGQVDLIAEVLTAMGIPSIRLPGYEADDLIATLSRQARDAGLEVLILSGDRDALQLVTEEVTVLYPRKGVSDMARMTPAAVEAKYHVTPQMYPDLAAIVGESSDNLPGVPGVGPGYASKWLTQYGSLDGVVEHADEITGKKGEALRSHLSQVLLNRQVNQLVGDLELPLTVADLERQPIDRTRVHEVFDALQFRVLRDRLFEELTDEVGSAGESLEVDVEAIAPGQVRSWLAGLSGTAGVWFDGQWGRGTGELWSLAIATSESAGHIDLGTATPDDLAAVSQWLADASRAKVAHDVKGAMLALAARGWVLGGLTMDTALAAYLALPGQRSFDLGDLCARFLGRELSPTGGDAQLALDDTHDATAGGVAARATLDLAEVFEKQLEERDALALLHEVELPLQHVLADMEATGIKVDVPHLEGLEAGFADQVRDAEVEAHRLAGRPFNLGSPKQLQEVLFVERGLPKTKRIKTGYTTDADALASLFAKTEDPLLETLLRWRDVSRLRQTVAGLLPLVDAHDRIHTTFNQTVAATGRLSSQDPNLQNIPVRTEAGRRIRAGFVVGTEYDCLLTADYSQIEMRIMAHLSGDEALIAALTSGEDLHTTVAARVFDVSPEEVDAEKRRRIKAMSYGLAYGLSAFGLSAQLGIDTGEARALMDDYFERFGGIRDYLTETVERARAVGYTETMFGRRRYLPDLTSDNRQRREMAERMALNAPIQGTAADIIKVAMIRVADALAAGGHHSRLLLQVHDELVCEIAPGERDSVTDLVRTHMAGAADLSVPLVVSTGSGANWDAAAH
ncbi:MAG: DNA polymerase I [Candidatus Nanopelagicales bacterium]